MLEISAIILTGGKSSRMGEDKCALSVAGKSILSRIIEVLRPVSSEIILAGGDGTRFLEHGLKFVSDRTAGLGPLSGMLAGLKASESSYNLIVSCDLPFINPGLIEMMARRAKGNQVVICKSKEGLEPLFAIYSKEVIPLIEEALRRGERRVISFFDQVEVEVIGQSEVAKIDPKYLSFFNINTPSDLETAEDLAEAGEDERT